ncbi:CPBP family intramembrane glutamic endopeptidase [Glutamicibacter arilaitensis]|uniref:CPBP family intramembrane metalloprotease n=2 Tax=Glutamicibacter arilaitensis TaxID=256701 RepID=A0A4Y8TU95_9MICC|nr:CPBP family intramembrane metalloprotease [Glutamicibacter arilaitensis]CBT75134.1 putative CAAX amino terminal protease family protein [Glutamicibacter arilaitensis Re117]HCH47220.1 CPBP family intramembrane metalloprotease [Glutamicibacter sp.]HCM93141.1 CPBP family intramembrane metalloprotease [Glutamicibacter sp.]
MIENVNAEQIEQKATRKTFGFEIVLVLALSLGQSAVYSLLSFADKVTRAPLREQTTSLNNQLSTREFFDFSYQLLDIIFALVPVVLALYLMKRTTGRTIRDIGFDIRKPGKDALLGAGLFLAMGVGTLGVYAAGRALGITTALSAANLGDYWWSVPVLLLSAVRHAVLEEVLMLGFLFTYTRKLKMGPWSIIILSAVIRGSYHLYQGAGPMIGNMLMGVVFGWIYQKYGRVMPLVIAHFLLDAIGFVGYALIGPAIGIGQ